jgi:hypothetical protein
MEGGSRGGFSNRGRGRGWGGGRGQGSNRLCTHCGRSNHTIEYCYALHGYPPGYKPKNNKGGTFANVVSQDNATDGNTFSNRTLVE